MVEARRRHCRSRASFCPTLAFAALAGSGAMQVAAAPAPANGCEALPKPEQTRCWALRACATIDDEVRRQECFRAVAGEDVEAAPVGEDAEAASDARTGQEAAPTSQPPRLANDTAAASAETAETDTPTRSAVPADSPKRPEWDGESVDKRTVERTVLQIPRRFSAQVTARRELLHNRQLIALDGELVFETDRASQSHLKVGDRVDVVRASSLFARRFRISGPSRGTVTGTRLRCEHLEVSADTRRKCVLLGASQLGERD